jgi:F0F1-type ATP synthase membrane subunit b/b'
MATTVPMTSPATVVKNSDGTYTVRVQHTVAGSITNVDFTNVLFAEVLANGYAAMLNGQAVVEANIGKLAADAGPVLADAKTDIKKLLAEAEVEAEKLIAAAKVEAQTIKADAMKYYEDGKAGIEKDLAAAKAEALTLLNEARTEASKLIKEAAAKIDTSKPAAPAAKSAVTEEDEA